MKSQTRVERDTLGEMKVPAEALWGASTQRAVLNFSQFGEPLDPRIIHAFGRIKAAAAKANAKFGVISDEISELIVQAANEVASGELDSHFVVDTFQTGSGTSTNMNANEVIANRVSQLTGGEIGSRHPVHPNDHVNASQSSNDTFPTAIHLAMAMALKNELLPVLGRCREVLSEKAEAFHEILKIGRTHLMDATPVRLGQEFSGYARQLELSEQRCRKAIEALLELPLGGTAVGTGLNCPEGFPEHVIEALASETGLPFRRAKNPFEAQGARDGVVEASGLLKTIAVSLFKVANDLRWLASGPRTALGEITMPATQPGSSIMPGKVNPVICEALLQVCAQVIGNDTAVTWGGTNGQFELNTAMPMMAQNVLRSTDLLSNGVDIFTRLALDGLTANEKRCLDWIEWSMAMVTKLAPRIGYEMAADIANEAFDRHKTVREICEERGILPPDELNEALDPKGMV